ncbi:dTDP-4-dehydrorhamnose 3,5-epimerase [Paracandidimonas lactea]|uniref:dTDP-4-dehydrorhamnose 3,5-epimerase n=1 Tax=Paracandidimonas lactea TaxID=2895524 RepID=UPI001F01E904|nr:dTDP-4-dehydrorhamnose 3,5-epimerase [Paracandidimonas lactea]
MKARQLSLPGVYLIEPDVHTDARGYFYESYNQERFEQAIGRAASFVQDNHSHSKKNVLRGLHYQVKQPQAKLIRVVAGEVFDVAVDLRQSSLTFGKWIGTLLSAANKHQLWIPEGFAHGFMVVSDHADVLYKATDHYAPQHERCIAWDDPDLGIRWPSNDTLELSPKDRQGSPFRDAELFT